MGSVRLYNGIGGFSQYLYHQIGPIIKASNGVEGKIIAKLDDERSLHSSLPSYSSTSEVYLKCDDQDPSRVEQMRVYKNRKVILDFDWNHQHRSFREGVVHVHQWRQLANGHMKRDKEPRFLNNDEIERYGELLHKVAPSVKFR